MVNSPSEFLSPKGPRQSCRLRGSPLHVGQSLGWLGCLAEQEREVGWAPSLDSWWAGGASHPREGAVFPVTALSPSVPVQAFSVAFRGSAAHAVLDIHKAQPLPAFPLLCHLWLNGCQRVRATGALSARTLPRCGHPPSNPGPGCGSALAQAKALSAVRTSAPNPSSQLARHKPNLVQLGNHPT